MTYKILTIEEAERSAGFKLDKRRKYFLHDFGEGPKVCFDSYFISSCSGCYVHEFADNYPYDPVAMCRIGSGCQECGYTGKRKIHFPVPATPTKRRKH